MNPEFDTFLYIRYVTHYHPNPSKHILQKILYLTHAYSLAKFDKPFVSEPFEAWKHGPILPSLYYTLKIFKPRKDNFFINRCPLLENELVLPVLKQFREFSVEKIVEISKNGPWNEVYFDNKLVIPDELIKAYFKPLLKE